MRAPISFRDITNKKHMPATPAANDEVFAPEDSAAQDRTLPSNAPSLVIADGNPWVRSELARGLAPYLHGASVREARSPAEVLIQIAEPHCSVLLIDPCMPTVGQSDGIPLLRRICCLRKDLLVVVLAQTPRKILADAALPARIEHVHAKTIDPQRLYCVISEALQQARPPSVQSQWREKNAQRD